MFLNVKKVTNCKQLKGEKAKRLKGKLELIKVNE